MSQYFDLSIRRIEIKKPKRDLKPVIKLQDEVNKTLLHDVAAIDDGELLLYKFSDPDKVKSDKAVGVKYRLSEKQVRTRIEKVVQAFKKKSPTFFTDYYYDTDNADTNICLQVA